MCPSVRLRPLSIPLWNIPIIKQEVTNYRIDSHQQTKGVRRSMRGSPLNEKPKQSQDTCLPQQGQGTRRPPVRNDMKKLLKEIRQEYLGGSGLRRGRNLVGKDQKNAEETRRKERKFEKEPAELETNKNNMKNERYICKFCKKVFDTPFGRNVHVRSHKKCRGCKKEFPFPSALRYHKTNCEKLKKLLLREALRTNPQQSQSREEMPSKSQVFVRKEDSASPSSHSDSSVQKDDFPKIHRCTRCNKKFHVISRLKEHMRLHGGEKPFTCSVCLKKFHIQQALKTHMTRMHKDAMGTSGTNGDLTWTKPLEDTEDNREDLISPSDNTKCTINLNNVQGECSPRWHRMGVRSSNGFICLMCQKVVKTKRQLVEHFRLHTGEKPLECECSAKFRTSAQLYIHKKQCRWPAILIQCEKCKKRFSSQARYNKHVSTCQKTWPLVCKFCGKGFFLKGCLRNHVAHNHSQT
ncbi:zinc finger protein 878-like isoform X2 [Channa argus]